MCVYQRHVYVPFLAMIIYLYYYDKEQGEKYDVRIF